MATIQKRPGKKGSRYTVSVRYKGETAAKTFGNLRAAQRWGHETEKKIDNGTYHQESTERTLGEAIDAFLDGRQEGRSRPNLERHLKYWKVELGKVRLSALTQARIVTVRDKLAAGKTPRGKRSPATVNRYLGSLSVALSWAKDERGWLRENPAKRVKKLKEPRGRVRFLSDDERDALLTACRKSDDYRLAPLVACAIYTGARRGELLRLKWSDIDSDRNVAVLHQTKNDQRRAIPLNAPAREALAGLAQRMDTPLIFAGPFDGEADTATFPRGPWERAVKRAKIKDLHFHDLRHTAASYLAMSGASLAEIAGVLGHKSLSMVARYAHLAEAHTVGIAEQMGEKFG